MKLQTKLLLSFGLMLVTTFVLIEIYGYQQTRGQILTTVSQEAKIVRSILMATRRVYHHQFLDSEIPLNTKTLGFLPAHALSLISDDFKSWSKSGMSFNNVSDRPRNQQNQADGVELEAMAYFRANPTEKERMVAHMNERGETYYHFSSPILVEKYCLECHGSLAGAPEAIRNTYDKAYDYEAGELRGLMSIKLPSTLVMAGVIDTRLQIFTGHLMAFLLAFVFGAWLLNRLVVRRLAEVQAATALVATGDYTARIPVRGKDELSDVAVAFNAMAEQRLQAKAAAEESEFKFRTLADHTLDWEYWINPEGEYVYISPACKRISGYSPEDFISNPQLLTEIIQPAYLEKVLSHHNASKKEQTPASTLVFPIVAKSGEERWLEHNCTAIFDQLGNYAGRRGNNRDITERKRAEERQRQSEQILIDALDATSDGVWSWDLSANLLTLDERSLTMFGLSLANKKVKPEDLLQFISVHDRDLIETALAALLNGSSSNFDQEFLVQTSAGEAIWIRGRGKIIQRDSNGNAIRLIGTNTNITKRKQFEVELRQKNKMEAVGYMAGGMAHNFNNNLAIILSSVELAKLKQPRNSDVIALLENAKTGVQRSRDLVQKIIIYSRKGVTHKAPMHLTTIIDSTISLLSSTLPATVALQKIVSPEGDSIVIASDPSQIQDVLINLCNNAVQAMDEKGELKIKLEPVELTQQEISAQYDCPPGCYVKLSVQDCGCGMPAEMLDKIFDPFYSTKEAYEGAGMGLATVQGIVAQHGGFIKVSSAVNQGTSFDLYFPIIEPTSSVGPVAENTTLPKGTERILD